RIIETHVRSGFNENDGLFVERARDAFVGCILQEVFESKKGAGPIGWSRVEFVPTPAGSLMARMDGSFSDQFPRRVVAVQVVTDPARIEAPRSDVDLNMDFLLRWGA